MLSEAKNVIRNCEERLRRLVAEAAASGQYDDVEVITEWARTLNRLIATSHAQENPAATADSQEIFVSEGGTTAPNRHPPSKSRTAYPRFARTQNELVKIGWSKKERKEYIHRAPWGVVELLCQRLIKWGNKEFTTEDILPLLWEDDVEVPSYQSYLCLAWLRDKGLIHREGRQGYVIPQGIDVVLESSRAWKNLPSNY